MFDGALTATEEYGLCAPSGDDQVLALLIEGRARVARAWWQSSYVGPRAPRWRFGWPMRVWDEPVCALGAVGIRAVGITRKSGALTLAQNEAIATLAESVEGIEGPWLPSRYHPIGEVMLWNDCRGRTQAEVVALFDDAIARRQMHLAAA